MPKIHIPTPAERRAAGKKFRDKVGRADQGIWKPARGRDVLAAIHEGTAGRLPALIPIKMGRMAESPFAFFRGAAALTARDLSRLPCTGLRVQLCGDAHVRNLGAYAAPDGRLVFDLNDFDETIHGPWEWDLKRLAASIILTGREAGDTAGDSADAVREMVECYRESLEEFSEMKVLELAKFAIHGRSANDAVREVLQKAERVTPARTLKKLTKPAKDGWPRFHDSWPPLRHVSDRIRASIFAALKPYRDTITAGRQLILDAYHPVDVAFKVVGTGSIGTRDYVVLFFANGIEDPLFLQFKEEKPSCYLPYLDCPHPFKHEGRRVAQGQQRMQTVVDPFLGWTTIDGREFLVRQLSDHKAAIDPGELKGGTLREYAWVCGRVLAKAHARTGDPAMLSGYCGGAATLDKAIAKFARSYADQAIADYQVFRSAIKAGKIKVA